jgi:hypothetical protein
MKAVWKRLATRHARQFVKHVMPAVMKPALTLWNEVIGFLFLVFGVIFGVQAVRYAMAGDAPRLFIAGFCTLVMAWFGVSSFLRARRIARS